MSDLILPGLIDVHTHLRVPGGEHKEDFATGTAAALAGGVTMILGMPNTSPPLSTPATLAATRETAARTIRCDVGLFAGASPAEVAQLAACAPHAVALKVYLNDTFGPLRVDDVPTLRACFRDWPRGKLIAMHAEKQSVAVGIGLAAAYQRPVHFCHVSRREEIELIADAKMAGLPVTCEVTPHHLFLDAAAFDRLGPLADMRPVLGTPDDVAALWAHLGETVDCIATDHAPHTLAEKQLPQPPPGVAGLETSLPLMLTAVHEGRLTLARLIDLMHTNPRRIFALPPQRDTWVEVDAEASWVIQDEMMYSKCGWTPFAGIPVKGKVRRVILRNQLAFEDGLVLAPPGSGQLLPQTTNGKPNTNN
ncbi:MAG: amidohydrolase family protein [Anaerolineales bacterium]|nr:amidohydrolase family protein [Anaerolineales bacterium]MCB8952803.1 amidohydrolase family protein [Ardenticatenales bacterium]